MLADDLERILVNGPNGNGLKNEPASGIPWEIPKDKDKGFPLLNVIRPEVPWERLVLPPGPARQLEALTDENHRRDLLL